MNIINTTPPMMLWWKQKMRTDNVVRVDAINVLLANLGELDTERFISMTQV